MTPERLCSFRNWNNLILCALLPLALGARWLGSRAANLDGYSRIAAAVEAASRRSPRLRVAVLDFPYVDGRASEGPQAVREQVALELAAARTVEFVGEDVRGELTDDLFPAGRGGRERPSGLADADALLTGRLAELANGRIEIDAKLIRLPDGVVLSAIRADVERTWREDAPPAAERDHWIPPSVFPAEERYHAQEEVNRFVRRGFDELQAAEPGAGREGRELYDAACLRCHGPEGRGSAVAAAMFGLAQSDLDLARRGAPKMSARKLLNALTIGSSQMPKLPYIPTEQEGQALASHLRALLETPSGCLDAARRGDRMQAGVLDLKTRYWARRLEEAPAGSMLAPDAYIRDPALRQEFWTAVRERRDSGRPAALSADEARRLIDAEAVAASLLKDCRR